MRQLMLALPVLMLIASCTRQPGIAQYGGPQRNGHFPGKGLLKQWPADGPKLLWFSDTVGDGYGSPVVTHDALFVTGAIESTSYLYSFDLNGNLQWKVAYGPEWAVNFPGSRSAPTVVGELIYVSSG
jgi:outer membrane protein assembly factor BamB